MPTQLELEQAMMNAHRAGDVQAARALAAEISQLAPPKEGPGFVDRSLDTIADTFDKMTTHEGLEGSEFGNDPMSRTREALSEGVAGVGSIFGDAVMSAGKAILPEEAQKWIGDKAQAVAQSEPVQTVARGVGEFSEAYPHEAKELGETLNIATAFAGGPRRPKGDKWYDTKYKDWDKANRRTKVQHLLEPDEGDLLEHGKLRESSLRNTKWEPGARYQAIIDETAKVKGVNPNRGYVHNLNAISDEVGKMRDSLDATLADMPNIKLGGGNNFYKKVDDLVQKLDDTPTMSGDAGNEARRIYRIFHKKLQGASKNGEINPKDLMQLRRDLDNELMDFKANIMDPTNLNAQTLANRELRTLINDTIADHAGDAIDVKKSLGAQSRLLSALEVVGPRAQRQSRNAFGRLLENIERSTGLKHPTTPVAVGVAATNPLVAAGTALSAFLVGGGHILNRSARKAIQLGIASGDIVLSEADRLTVLAALEAMDKEEKEERKKAQ